MQVLAPDTDMSSTAPSEAAASMDMIEDGSSNARSSNDWSSNDWSSNDWSSNAWYSNGWSSNGWYSWHSNDWSWANDWWAKN